MSATAGRRERRLLADRVRDELMRKIQDGSFTTGEKLPAEPELSDAHGVSRATIREAVRGLVEAGYLSRVHGSGTYVAFRPTLRHTLERNLSYTRLIEQAGFTPGRSVLGVESTRASDEEAEQLGLADGSMVIRVERVRSADARPVIYSIDAIPSRFLTHVPESELGGSLYELFDRLGYRVAHGEAVLEPVLARGRQVEALGVEEGTALLHMCQTDYTTEGEAMMYSLEWHVPGIFELSLVRRGT